MTQETEWRAERQPNTVGQDWWRAIIYGRYGKTIVSHLDEPTARLIAASLDMQRALEKAEEWLEGWASAEPYLSEIRAALAKSRPKT